MGGLAWGGGGGGIAEHQSKSLDTHNECLNWRCIICGYNKTLIWTPPCPILKLFCLCQKYWSRPAASTNIFASILDAALSNNCILYIYPLCIIYLSIMYYISIHYFSCNSNHSFFTWLMLVEYSNILLSYMRACIGAFVCVCKWVY